MYNRYLRNDNGDYTRIYPAPLPETAAPAAPKVKTALPQEEKHSFGFFDQILSRLHLDDLDSADLMLLLLLFFLFEEKADEELLIALGLLLIL